MFVNAVKFMDSPERKIPTFIWFEEIESFYRFWPDTIYKSSLSGFITSNILRDRKSILGCDSASRNDQHVAHEVIESSSEIVGNVTHASGHIGRADGSVQESVSIGDSLRERNHDIIRNAISSLSITLSDDHCTALCDRDVGCQITEMLLGPLNFYANENESFVGSKQRQLLLLTRS